MNKKKTRLDYFNEIRTHISSNPDLVAFVDNEISKIESRRMKVAIHQADDELKDVLYEILTDKYQTSDELISQIEGGDVTRAKIVPRLNKLIEEGKAVKEYVKYDSRRIVAYKRKD